MRAREIKGRNVLDIGAASVVAEVVAVILDPDEHRVAGFRISGSQPVLPWDGMKAIGADALTIDGPDALREAQTDAEDRATNLPIEPLGMRVLLENGTEVGVLDDLDFDTDTGEITELVVAGANHHGDRLLGVGDFALVLAQD